jgi:hypothetical protein
MKNLKFILILFILALASIPGFAQVLETPADYVDPHNVSTFAAAITALVTIVVAYFSALIPGLKNISDKTIRVITTSLIIVAGAGAFRFGFLTKETFEFAVTAFLPNFGGSAFIYELLKMILNLFGVKLKTLDVQAPKND